jgi:acyl-CoA reductase-like NAD-dependent aldehyde dehydrogenase
VIAPPPVGAEACRAARRAHPAWAGLDLDARARVLARAARLLAAEAEGAAALLTRLSGRPAVEAWSSEIVPTVDALRWLARRGAAALRPRRLPRSRLQWYFRPTRQRLAWEPYGLVAVVTPGNALLFLGATQVAAALLGGNAVVWKPAPRGTAMAQHVAALFARAGLPPGLLEVVPGDAEAARALVDAGVDKLFFTGSSEAGRALYARQAAHGRPAVLELSGRHVALVLADADPELTARGLAWGKLTNAGRHCVSVQLVLVEPPAEAALLEALSRALVRHAPGPEDGPDRARLEALVADAVARGARRVGTGPALLAGVTRGMRVVDEEVQGPILAVAALDSAAQALAWVNDAPYRLSASIWTRDVRRARRLAADLDVGHVWINDALHPVAQPEVPLAGRGESGFGASRGLPGLFEMVQPKVVAETPLGASRRHFGPVPAGAAELFRATVRLAAIPGRVWRGAALAQLVAVLARLARERP